MIVGVGRWVADLFFELFFWFSSFFTSSFFFFWMLVSILLLNGRPEVELMMVAVWVGCVCERDDKLMGE